MNTPILSLDVCIRSFIALLLLGMASGCSTGLPSERHETYRFPEKSVFIEEPVGKDQGRPYEVLGWVRAKAHYPTMEQDNENPVLCRNYYNKAARELLKEAIKANADAVIKVRSIVFLLDGKFQEHPTPECADDGAEGEVLLRGVAIRWKPKPEASKKQ